MAIAFSGAADLGDNGGSSGTLTGSYSVSTGSNRLLIASVLGANGNDPGGQVDDVNTPTYAGVQMTLGRKVVPLDGATRVQYFYYLLSPTVNSNTFTVTSQTSHYLLAVLADYTGVLGVDVNGVTNDDSNAQPSSLTSSLTTSADNSWVMLTMQGFNSNNAPGAGSGSVLRQANVSFGNHAIYDSGGVVHPAGSYSMTTTYPGASTVGIVHLLISFAPSGVPAFINRPGPGFLPTVPMTILGGGAALGRAIQRNEIKGRRSILLPRRWI